MVSFGTFYLLRYPTIFFRVGILQPQSQLLFYRPNPNEPLYVFKHTRLVMGSIGSSNHSTNALNYGSQIWDKLFPPLQPHRCGQVPEMKGAVPSSLYLDLIREGRPLDPRTCQDQASMEKIIKDSSYADNIFLMSDDARTLKERFYRVLTMLNYYDMNIHEIFSNNSDLLNDLVTECDEMNIKLELHPSLILKSSEKTITSLSENNPPPPNKGQKGWEPTSSIETPPPFLSGDSTPPNLEIDLERDETSPKSLTDPLSDTNRGRMKKTSLAGCPHLTKKGNFSQQEVITTLAPPQKHQERRKVS